MTCPDWQTLVDRRDERPDAWDEALQHFDQCADCHTDALTAEPTLLFRRLPAPEVGEADIESMKTAVAALRRTQAYNQPSKDVFAAARVPKRRATQWLQLAAALVATVGVALLLGSGMLADKGAVDPGAVVLANTASSAVVAQVSEEDREVSTQLQALLGHEDYLELARQAMSAEIGQQIRYSLSERYSILFRLGAIAESLDGNRRLRLDGFRIFENPTLSANKSRQMEPLEVLSATLDLHVGHADAGDDGSFRVTVSASRPDTDQ